MEVLESHSMSEGASLGELRKAKNWFGGASEEISSESPMVGLSPSPPRGYS